MKFFLILIFFPINVFALCVVQDNVALYHGPSTKHLKTWTVSKYMPFKKVAKERGWYQVQDLDNDYHWIQKSKVTSKYKCAVVKSKWASLRTGPGRKYRRHKKYSKAEKYVTFRFLKRKGQWSQVEDTSWVKKRGKRTKVKEVYWVFSSLIWVY